MTWNPRDASLPNGGMAQTGEAAFRLPEPPDHARGETAGYGVPPSLHPGATPTVAEAMGWTGREDDTPAMPPEMERTLTYQGIYGSGSWDRWRSMLLRGHYE